MIKSIYSCHLDPNGYYYQNSVQFRDEALSMVSFKILLEISSAYLTVADPESKKKKPASELSSNDSITTTTSDEEFARFKATKRDDKPRIILYTINKTPAGGSILIMIDLTKEIADQVYNYFFNKIQANFHFKKYYKHPNIICA